MKIYNSLGKTKEEFAPREDKKVRMFVCGPTVYDYIHIGNARTFVFFDVVAKYLRHIGFEVQYIQNITDIDDRIILRSQEMGQESLVFAKKYEEIFLKDVAEVGINGVSQYARATDHILEVMQQVKTLIAKGHAYKIEDDGWYFDLSTFSDYGKLSGRTAEQAEDATSRIDESINKRNKGDFALWKFSKMDSTGSPQAGEPAWESELGKGRPGWHIEDTAITEKYFGPQYDLHGAGQDLIFPHHEAEIAQQESASGIKPFVKYWMHSAFLVNKEKKMSKSLGNFMSLNEALKIYSPETLRFYFLSAHYRSSLDFSEEILKQAEAAVMRINEFRNKLRQFEGKDLSNQENSEETKEAYHKIIKAMDDDFNAPEAIGAFFELIRRTNPKIETKRVAMVELIKILNFFEKVLGIVPEPIIYPSEVQELIDQREKSRETKDFTSADQLRSQIESLGYQIDDTIYGTLVKPKK